ERVLVEAGDLSLSQGQADRQFGLDHFVDLVAGKPRRNLFFRQRSGPGYAAKQLVAPEHHPFDGGKWHLTRGSGNVSCLALGQGFVPRGRSDCGRLARGNRRRIAAHRNEGGQQKEWSSNTKRAGERTSKRGIHG